MDDCLPFSPITLSHKTHEMPTVTGEYLLTEISPSRVMSFSMFIDPINDLKGILCFDQILELCFVASVLSNPFWFEHTLTLIKRKHLDTNDSFNIGNHPITDWNRITMTTFGSWQGGPHNRWSPFGGGTQFPKLFGANADATEVERQLGYQKLEAVLQILYHHLQWVNSLEGTVDDVIRDLPLQRLEEHLTTVTQNIFKITPCQFSVFRLMVFTTIAIGCGAVIPGTHLKALMYPVKGSASYKHLMNPNQDQISRSEAVSLCRNEEQDVGHDQLVGIESQHHDQLMLYISAELGNRKYLRDEIECILCESHPNRNLQCRDWFKKGRRIYDTDENGSVLQRDYGKETQWTNVERLQTTKLAFLKEVVTYKEFDEKLYQYAISFGDVLLQTKNQIKFCDGRTTTTRYLREYKDWYQINSHEKQPPINFRVADVIGSEHGISDAYVNNECNNINDYPAGACLWKYVLETIHYRDTNVCKCYRVQYHQQDADSGIPSRTSIIEGTLDKPFDRRVVFTPIQKGGFFSIVAVPKYWYVKQHERSYRHIQEWMMTLSEEECQSIHSFLQDFHHRAQLAMKMFDVDVLIYFNSAGTMLAFPGHLCFYGLIIPGQNNLDSQSLHDFLLISTTMGKES